MKRRYIMMLATSAVVGLAIPAPVRAVAVSPDGTYYKPSFPANKPPTTVPACPIDACLYVDSTNVYQGPLQSAIAKLEPFTIEAGNTEIDVENLVVSFSCVDPRQEDVEDCEDQAWDAYQAALNGTHSKPGPWSDFTGAWEDYQDALAACQGLLNGPWAGYSSVEIEGDLSSGNSEGSIEVTAKLEIDTLCRAEVCITDIEYDYDMGGWVGLWGSLFGGGTTVTLVDGNGDHYPLSGGTGSVCLPLSEVLGS